MSTEMDGPGISGFGYGNQGGSEGRPDNDRDPQPQAQSTPSPAAEDKQPASGAEAQAAHDEARSQATNSGTPAVGQAAGNIAQELTLDRDYVPGFETSASDCLKRAVQIARSLNHTDLSADHLMLALTMDENARRQLERVGELVQLREVAMERLGRNYTRSSTHSSDLSPVPTSDLADIGTRAREAAAERDQLVSISDLISAFPKENGRLTYAARAGTQALALMEKIEQGLVPRVGDAMDRIEATVQNALQRHQTVQTILEDLGYRAQESEQRQKDLMEDVRRQVREIAEAQLTALRDFDMRLDNKLAELDRRASEQANLRSKEGDSRGKSYLSWLLP